MASRADLTIKINNDLATGTSITATEHRGVEQAIVDSCKPYNIGSFIISDVGGSTGTLGSSGILSAQATVPFANISKIVVLFNTATPMPNTNYYVRIFIKSNQNTAQEFYDVLPPYFTNLSTTGFDMYIREFYAITQSITVYFEAIPLD